MLARSVAVRTLLVVLGIVSYSNAFGFSHTSTPLRKSREHATFLSCDAAVTDDVNLLTDMLQKLKSGSDIRGQFVEHENMNPKSVADAIKACPAGSPPSITPFAAHCFGYSFAKIVDEKTDHHSPVISVGRDPRDHGARLASEFCGGAAAYGAQVKYTGLASTPSMFEFCRAGMSDGGVMVTASHLPMDRNGLKFFTKNGGFTKDDIQTLIAGAIERAEQWNGKWPTSDEGKIEDVDFLPSYANTLREALAKEANAGSSDSLRAFPLKGMKIVLNAGNGAGTFFREVLEDLGADTSASLGIAPDPTFPNGIPNPESPRMVQATIDACEKSNADIGIMLDTDADRCGCIVPRTVRSGNRSGYEPVNGNRLIALLGVIFSTACPGCAFVTDSVTSEGLTKFLEQDLGLKHVRFLRGYANVIGKAKELTANGEVDAEVAIETSGHCAMRENGYLDDGTYTAVKIVGLLSRVARDSDSKSMLDLISKLEEMEEVRELRMCVTDGSVETTRVLFDSIVESVKGACEKFSVLGWALDEDNLEGIRIRTDDGGFFMLRMSLHDPVVSFVVESSKDQVKNTVVLPVLEMLKGLKGVNELMDISSLEEYSK